MVWFPIVQSQEGMHAKTADSSQKEVHLTDTIQWFHNALIIHKQILNVKGKHSQGSVLDVTDDMRWEYGH